MKKFLKLSAIVSVISAAGVIAATPSFAAKRHQQNANPTTQSDAVQSYGYENGPSGVFVNDGAFGAPNDPTSYEGRVRSEGN